MSTKTLSIYWALSTKFCQVPIKKICLDLDCLQSFMLWSLIISNITRFIRFPYFMKVLSIIQF